MAPEPPYKCAEAQTYLSAQLTLKHPDYETVNCTPEMKETMAPFLFCCPNTGLNAQAWVADNSSEQGDELCEPDLLGLHGCDAHSNSVPGHERPICDGRALSASPPTELLHDGKKRRPSLCTAGAFFASAGVA